MQKNYALPAWFAGPLFYGDDTYLVRRNSRINGKRIRYPFPGLFI